MGSHEVQDSLDSLLISWQTAYLLQPTYLLLACHFVPTYSDPTNQFTYQLAYHLSACSPPRACPPPTYLPPSYQPSHLLSACPSPTCLPPSYQPAHLLPACSPPTCLPTCYQPAHFLPACLPPYTTPTSTDLCPVCSDCAFFHSEIIMQHTAMDKINVHGGHRISSSLQFPGLFLPHHLPSGPFCSLLPASCYFCSRTLSSST